MEPVNPSYLEVRKKKKKAVRDGGTSTANEYATTESSIFTFILLITTLLLYDMKHLSNDKHAIIDSINNSSVQAIQADLLSKVHHQTKAINVIMESLNDLNKHKQKTNVLNLIGSTGVGKTFITNIIKNHVKPPLLEVNGPLSALVQQRNKLNEIKFIGNNFNLIIIDNLTLSDVDNLLQFIFKIPKNCVVFLICIFNIQETDDNLNHSINYDHINDIKKKFDENGIGYYKIANFHEFTREQATDWVIQQLIIKGIDSKRHSEITNNILDGQNIKYHGLKGLHSKINLELSNN